MIGQRARWLLVAAVTFCFLLATNWLPALRGVVPFLPGNAGWEWLYRLPRWLWLIPIIAVLALYGWGAQRLLHDPARFPCKLLAWAYVATVLFPLLLTQLEGEPLSVFTHRILSKVMGAYPTVATRIEDLGDTLRQWPTFTADYQATANVPAGGAVLDPPGLTVLYYGVQQGFAQNPALAAMFAGPIRAPVCQNFDLLRWTDAQLASAWVQWWMPLWAALVIAPLYALSRRLFGESAARWAVLLYPLVPGLMHFAPRFNTFYPLITVVMLLLLWRGVARQRSYPWQIFAAGFVLSGGMFFNLSLVPLGLLAGLYILVEGWAGKRSVFVIARQLAWFGAGAASIWAVYGALSGVLPWTVISAGMGRHLQMNRPYLPWLLMHPYDMFLFVGLPIAVLAVWQMARQSIRMARLRGLGDAEQRLTVISAVTLILLVLSGTARGETGRVWLFLAPLWVMLAASVIASWNPREQTMAWAAQALTLLTMGAFIQAYLPGLTAPAIPDPVMTPPTFPFNARFERKGEALTLVGLSLNKTPQAVEFVFEWRAETPIQHPYVLSMVRVPPDGAFLDSVTWVPYNGDFPPSCWPAGKSFVERHTVPLGEIPKAGDWQFSLSILDPFSAEPMSVTYSDGTVSTQVGIAPVNIAIP